MWIKSQNIEGDNVIQRRRNAACTWPRNDFWSLVQISEIKRVGNWRKVEVKKISIWTMQFLSRLIVYLKWYFV